MEENSDIYLKWEGMGDWAMVGTLSWWNGFFLFSNTSHYSAPHFSIIIQSVTDNVSFIGIAQTRRDNIIYMFKYKGPSLLFSKNQRTSFPYTFTISYTATNFEISHGTPCYDFKILHIILSNLMIESIQSVNSFRR